MYNKKDTKHLGDILKEYAPLIGQAAKETGFDITTVASTSIYNAHSHVTVIRNYTQARDTGKFWIRYKELKGE